MNCYQVGKMATIDLVMDDYYSNLNIVGMPSKSKGQVLRVAAIMHVLFHMHSPETIPKEISEDAVKAADCFVDICMSTACSIPRQSR